MSNSTIEGGVKTWYTAMPLYQGRLLDILPLEISAIEEVMLQLFDGVYYMHGRQVLHKDIKPENVLVKGKSRPDVVLADYGICASLSSQAELMSPAGTPGYAAPEVSRMAVQTQAVDVFALGALFFAILEPERCHGPDATVATLGDVMRRPPKIYGGLVQTMMAQDPMKRPSVEKCFDVVRNQQRNWKKRNLLRLQPLPTPIASGPRRSQRIQNAIVQKAPIVDPGFGARRHRLTPIVESRLARKPLLPYKPPERPFKAGPQPGVRKPSVPHGPPERLLRVWDQPGRMHGRRILLPPPAPVHEPQTPAPVQQVDFSVRPPAIPDNPFADLPRAPDPPIAPPPRGQPFPTPHEPARTPIHKPDTDIKRAIRRGPERRQMIERWHRIRTHKNALCDAADQLLASGTPLNVLRGLTHITGAGVGFTNQYLGLIFRDLKVAGLALEYVGARGKRWGVGLGTERRLVYGLRSRGCWPMTREEYERERLLSRMKFTDTMEGRR